MSEQLIRSFNNYTKSVEESFVTIRQLLDAGRYIDAADVMSLVTTRQAQVSIRMRNSCDKLGNHK